MASLRAGGFLNPSSRRWRDTPFFKGRFYRRCEGSTFTDYPLVFLTPPPEVILFLCMLSDSQLQFVSETLSNIGLVFFASMVVPFFTSTEIAWGYLLSGSLLSFGSWLFGLVIIIEVKL